MYLTIGGNNDLFDRKSYYGNQIMRPWTISNSIVNGSLRRMIPVGSNIKLTVFQEAPPLFFDYLFPFIQWSRKSNTRSTHRYAPRPTDQLLLAAVLAYGPRKLA